ncbi:MAG: indole-3-glycerol-phosphate synthase TrpC, partial [Candidatus Marinimicrobia bacterium]|nr:indole-3-glycerol-phosphate synthase TrpC [Candidatus Neomarinimicrobiota bacterium]
MSILNEIIAHKRHEVERASARVPLDRLPSRTSKVRNFAGALSGGPLKVIAEVKLQSPSRGPIRPGADPAKLARSY